VTAFVAGLALLFGPPSPVLHSQGDDVTAGRGSYCWAGERDANGLEPRICADTFKPPAVSTRSLPVRRGGRMRVDMRTDTDSLTATLRGRRRELSVTGVGGSRRGFVVQLPRHLRPQEVLDLGADYPEGDGSFGALIRTKPPTAPPRPVLEAAGERLTMARGSYCWSRPPVGLCVDSKPPTTTDALGVRRDGQLRVDMRIGADLLDASIRGGPRHLRVWRVGGSERRFVVRLPRHMKLRSILELFARYAQGDGFFGARLRVRQPAPRAETHR
jgi:hypothetical protein